MGERAFTEKTPEPDEASLARVLGKAAPWWRALLEGIRTEAGETAPEWKWYSTGWTLKVLRGKRNLLLLLPHRGSFRAGFTFSDRAVEAVEGGGFPEDLVRRLREARRYAEGRGLRVDVLSRRDVDLALRLVRVKLAS